MSKGYAINKMFEKPDLFLFIYGKREDQWGVVLLCVEQSNPKIDAEIGKKGRSWTETI